MDEYEYLYNLVTEELEKDAGVFGKEVGITAMLNRYDANKRLKSKVHDRHAMDYLTPKERSEYYEAMYGYTTGKGAGNGSAELGRMARAGGMVAATSTAGSAVSPLFALAGIRAHRALQRNTNAYSKLIELEEKARARRRKKLKKRR